MMLTEKDLLLDIINLSPKNSLWKVSYSGEDIGDTIGSIATINPESKSFLIKLNTDTKSFLSRALSETNFTDWIIHQLIVDEVGHVIFKSYDHMTTSLVASKFPNKDALLSKYADMDLLELAV